MGSKKLIYCCILGIVLGFLAPFALKTDRYTSLMIGMVAGLGLGYLLDVRGDKQADQGRQVSLGEKADKANKLLERARRGVDNEYLRMEYDEEEGEEPEEAVPDEEETDPVTPITDDETEADEQAEKLSEAEELLHAARERMK
ncbi:MAG: hypothetical protein IJI07_05185 [Flexilinea sp.]|nr:hypothetical protein [Flexilinea sp.]